MADLVFIQALWEMFTFSIGQWMKRKDPETNFCEACLERRQSSIAGTEGSYNQLKGVDVTEMETDESR